MPATPTAAVADSGCGLAFAVILTVATAVVVDVVVVVCWLG